MNYDDDDEAVFCRSTFSNINLIQSTWTEFRKWLGNRWWHYIPAREIQTYFSASSVPIGSIAVAACQNTHYGNVCTVLVKIHGGRVTIGDVYVQNATYVCDTPACVHISLIDLMKKVRSNVTRGFFMPAPRTMVHKEAYTFSGRLLTMERMMSELNMLRALTEDAAIIQVGMVQRDDTYPDHSYPYAHILQQLKAGAHSQPGAILIFTGESMVGYLFSFITPNNRCSMVRFGSKGYTYDTFFDAKSFTTLSETIAYAKQDCSIVEFIKRGPNTLTELCRRMIAIKNLPIECLPKTLQSYVATYRGPTNIERYYCGE